MSKPEENSGWGFGFKEIIVLVFIIGFVALVVTPQYIFTGKDRSGMQANACINNMRQIDAAINEWALERGKTNGTVVVVNEITNYIKLNRKGQIPSCPSGGKYIYGKVGTNSQVTCSLGTNVVPAHVLPF